MQQLGRGKKVNETNLTLLGVRNSTKINIYAQHGTMLHRRGRIIIVLDRVFLVTCKRRRSLLSRKLRNCKDAARLNEEGETNSRDSKCKRCCAELPKH
ncbi:hypothetical protein PUN28_007699 [Cardiocondyla obscurior]|uniref:Uncharacterized protein n=1 Tax=Cardiocondyla obscurior TaxID=286306 RepID=A0AAW2FZC7_9HYME